MRDIARVGSELLAQLPLLLRVRSHLYLPGGTGMGVSRRHTVLLGLLNSHSSYTLHEAPGLTKREFWCWPSIWRDRDRTLPQKSQLWQLYPLISRNLAVALSIPQLWANGRTTTLLYSTEHSMNSTVIVRSVRGSAAIVVDYGASKTPKHELRVLQ